MTISRSAVTGVFSACGVVVLLAAVGFVDGQAIVEKIVQRLLTPVGLLWIGLAVQFRLSIARRHAGGACWAAGLWLALTVCGNGLLVDRLIGLEEQPFLNIDPLNGKPFDALVVLGGGASMGANGRPQVNSAGERIVMTAQMYQSGQARRIICTGQRIQALNREAPDPSELAVSLLKSLGVPPEVLVQSGGANTSEEFAHLSQVIKPGERVGLVTSAWHMPRALRLARKNGLHLEPVPAGFQGTPPDAGFRLGFGAGVFACIPDAEALTAAALWEKEQLARLVGR